MTPNATRASATNTPSVDADSSGDPSAGERIDHDQLFKLLLTEFFFEFLALFFPKLAHEIELGSIKFLDKELYTDIAQGYSHEADIVARARFRGREAYLIVHAENQAAPQSDFDRRMFWYFARLYEKFGLPVYPIVVFSYDAPRKPAPSRHTIAIAGRRILNFRYETVQLNRLKWRSFLRTDNPVAGALMAKMQIAKRDRPKVKAACLAMLGGLPLNDAQKRMLSAFVNTYLRLDANEEQAYRREVGKLGPEEEKKVSVLDVIEAQLKQEAMQKGLQQGIAEGLQQGINEGLQQGLQQGEARFALRTLTKRFGPLTPEVQEQINSLSAEALEALAEQLLSFTDTGQIQAWLNTHTHA